MTPAERRAPLRLRAPREHGQALVVPSKDEIGELLASQRASPLDATFVARARAEVLSAAKAHVSQYRDVPQAISNGPLILSGHQPELFHPGVWFKSFLLSSLAKEHGAAAVNLIIDNDVIDRPEVKVPTGTRQSPRVESIAFDTPSDAIPYEERSIDDESLFDGFDKAVCQAMRPWNIEPLVTDLWRESRAIRVSTNNLGSTLAAARHQLEQRCGLATLEVPLSTVVSQMAFPRFMLPLIGDFHRLREIYNSSLQQYRTNNRIRSRSHPVPDLAQEDEWCEFPLWIWSREQPRRQRLFVRATRAGLELTDRQALRFVLPNSEDAALQAWSDQQQRGIKLRPRALITTMYARLVLSDLFLHGIGGAKYDELTDEIIRRWFNSEPPRYVTATATLHLPIDYQRVSDDDLRAVQRQIRDLQYHAEHCENGAALVEHKRQLIAEMPPRGERKSWHEEITRVNTELAIRNAQARERLQQCAAELVERQRTSRLLGGREFSFALFPKEFVSNLLLDLSRFNA